MHGRVAHRCPFTPTKTKRRQAFFVFGGRKRHGSGYSEPRPFFLLYGFFWGLFRGYDAFFFLVSDADDDLEVNFSERQLLPVIDCGDNDFIVYDIKFYIDETLLFPT